eukprot:5014308-Pyramimonas_sp.AAC.1
MHPLPPYHPALRSLQLLIQLPVTFHPAVLLQRLLQPTERLPNNDPTDSSRIVPQSYSLTRTSTK